ncbi:MAG: MFS transporter [Sphingomonas sp.]
MSARPAISREFALLFAVMLTIAAGNTALQSVLPALGRSLGVADSAVAACFSVSALLWVIAAPVWAKRSDTHGRRAMILTGVGGYAVSLGTCGLFLAAGINGWIAGSTAFGLFIVGRLIYGGFGSAAPPAVQALVAGKTARDERTRALTLLASATGLGTILGPAIAPFLKMGSLAGIEIGLAGPAFFACALGVGMWIAVRGSLPRDSGYHEGHGAAASYPTIGGQQTGASVVAATSEGIEPISVRDARVRPWLSVGMVMGHAQAMTGQAIGFLVIDRLHLPPALALEPTGIVLMMGAGAALLVQWGLIPLFGLTPRRLVLTGLLLAAAGTVLTGLATSLYGIAVAYALASAGFGFTRPGFNAGASLSVGPGAQGSVAGRITSVNGASFVLGPSIGVGLYELGHVIPYVAAGVACLITFAICWPYLRDTVNRDDAS